MKTTTKLIITAVAALLIGAAYGSKVPGVEAIARKLPGNDFSA